MMTAEAVKLIQEKAVEAEAAWFHTTSNDPYAFYRRQRNADGSDELVREEMKRRSRSYQFNTLDDLAKAIEQFAGTKQVLVLCGESSIQAILQESDAKRDILRMPLCITSQCKSLLHLHKEHVPFNQRTFISLLRVQLNGCVDSTIISQIRTLKFSKSSTGESDLQPGKETLGNEVSMAAVTGHSGTALPDTIELQVTPFEEFPEGEGFTFAVKCALDLDIEAAEFRLIPLAGELPQMLRFVLREIADRLTQSLDGKGCDVLILCGGSQE